MLNKESWLDEIWLKKVYLQTKYIYSTGSGSLENPD